jgi:class 3 adenylate cyclase
MVLIGLILGCLAGAVILQVVQRTRMRCRMARHPSPTFVFADLVGYTALTDSTGDQEAVRVAREFERAMSNLSREHGAWHVKSMGDGVMIWAPDATQAVALAARALEEICRRPDLPPVRVGVHTGPAVMDRGDWYGGTVNVAARLAREARPNEGLVSDTTQSAAVRGGLQWSLKANGELALRGVGRPICVWRLLASPPVAARPTR